MKKRLYFDMDNVLVDFCSALELQYEATLKEMRAAVLEYLLPKE